MDLVTLLTVCAVAGAAPAMHMRCPNSSGAANGLVIEVNGAMGGLDDQHHTSSAIDQWQPWITEASRLFGVPAVWVRAVMRAESGGQTTLGGRPITSRTGAMGLMQLMPNTYAEMRQRYGLGADPYDPRDNILGGAAYLREMYDRYGYPGLFVAYNAGPARFDEYLLKGRPLPAETRRYLATLNLPLSDTPTRHDFPSGRNLFFELSTPVMGGQSQRPDASSGGLFAPLHKDWVTSSHTREDP